MFHPIRNHPRLSIAVVFVIVLFMLSFGMFRMGAVETMLAITGTTPPHDSEGRTNLLLLGVGDKRHAGADLTDVMMIASVDPATQSVVLLSIPRDLYLTGNNVSANGRINTLYVVERDRIKATNRTMSEADASHAALQAVSSNVSKRFGIPIHGSVKIDFTALTEAVDLLGGVNIFVPKTIIDYAYPIREGVTGLFKLTAGPHHLDGETALKYARTRHSGTDFDRSARQQQLMQAMMQKARGFSRLEQLLFMLYFLQRTGGHIETTFTTRQVLGLAQIATALSQQRILRTQIDYSFLFSPDPALYEGADVLLPNPSSGDPTGWKQLQLFTSLFVRHRDLFLQGSDVQVVDTAQRGNATSLESELRRYGFTVDPPAKRSVQSASPTSFITYSGWVGNNVASFLGSLLGMPVMHQSDVFSGTGSVRIVIGKEYRYQPLVELTEK